MIYMDGMGNYIVIEIVQHVFHGKKVGILTTHLEKKHQIQY